MKYVFQPGAWAGVSNVPTDGSRGPSLLVQVTLALFFVITCVSTISAQDLGELARQERARRQAEPPHEVHVYTNDDLARPKILIPEDDAKIKNQQPAPEPAVAPDPVLVEVPPAGGPHRGLPEAPLGDIARQNRAQKLALQQQARAEVQSSRPTHVYTNEDLAHPTILTPEDHEVFAAERIKLPPETAQIQSEIHTQEQSHLGLSLGEIARLYHVSAPAPAIKQRSRFPLLLGTTWNATPAEVMSVIRPPPRIRRLSMKFRSRDAAHRVGIPQRLADRTITVRPGDSLWGLAKRYLGRGRRWREIQKSNTWIRDPQFLKVGSQIRI